jgi:hypothetical protein
VDEEEFKEWRITEEDAAEMEAAMVVKMRTNRLDNQKTMVNIYSLWS